MRGVALTLALVFALLTSTVFTSGNGSQAHAFAPAVAVVAPTITRAVVVPVARAACRSVCAGAWGTVAGATVTAGEAVWCVWQPEGCTVPWKQNPDRPPNSPGGSYGGYWLTDPKSGVGQAARNDYQTATVKVLTNTGQDLSNGFIDLGSVNSGGWVSVDGFLLNESNGYVITTLRHGMNTGINIARGMVISVRHCYENGYCGMNDEYHIGPAGSGSPAPWNPPRQAQPYRTCKNAAGDVIRLPGPVTGYAEGTDSRTALSIPACPSTHPIPTGGGAVEGAPWTPGVVESIPGHGAPLPPGVTPLLPEQKPVAPELLPHRPTPTQPQTPIRTAPHRPGDPMPQPVPDIDPDTGLPKPDPLPLPPVVPDEGWCMWGGYAVDPADCDGAPAPEPRPEPTAPPTTTPTAPPVNPPASPQPSGTPAPAPDPFGPGDNGPGDPDKGTNCMSGAYSWNPIDWVFVPVKCALIWTFGIKPTTQARLGSIDVGGIPPFSVLTAVPNWLAPIANPGQTCPDWTVKVGAKNYSVVCDQGYTKKMHDNRVLFGTAMTLVLVAPLAWRVWRAAIPVLKVS